MTIPREREAPRYLQVAGELRAEILSGKFSARDQFPTESDLCQRYGVSRFTIREALRRLQNEGLIARKRGSGTVVQPAAARGGTLHQPLSNVGEILQYARDTHVTYEPRGRGDLPREIAEQIGEDTSGAWICFRGVRSPQL
ncbi:MAG: GntR family transcriptional regulator, partial [Novosphingobium sp.]